MRHESKSKKMEMKDLSIIAIQILSETIKLKAAIKRKLFDLAIF